VLFAHTGTAGDGPCDFQGSFSPMAIGDPGKQWSLRDTGATRGVHDVHEMRLHKLPAVNLLPCVLHPEGRGRVSLRSASHADPIRIEHEVIGNRNDLDKLVEVCKSLRAIMSAPAMAAHVVDERMPGPAVESDDDWREWLHAASWRGEHGVGTCRMGSDADAVVDTNLRVNGIEGLRVADASIFPTLTSGNTNAPTIMVAEKASDLILGRSAPPVKYR